MVQERDIFIHISHDCLRSCDYTGDKLLVYALLFNYGKQGKGLTVAQIQEIYDRILKRQLYRYLKEMLNEGKIIKSGKCIYQSVTKTQKSVTETQKSVKNDTKSVTETQKVSKMTLSHLIYSNKYNKYNNIIKLSLLVRTRAHTRKREREKKKKLNCLRM